MPVPPRPTSPPKAPGAAAPSGRGIPVIDAHVHVNRFDLMRPAAQQVIRSNPTFPIMERMVAAPAAFLQHLDREGIVAAWLINYCAKDVMGYGWEVNAWAARYAAADPRRLVAIGGYDPRHDGDAKPAIDALHAMGIRGLKLHAVHQHLSPDDPRLAPAFARLAEHGMPLVVHTGTSRFPGADNAYADPAPLGKVCRGHPDLQVIVAHGGRPNHTKTAMDLVARRDNAWLELSSCPPHRLAAYFGDLDAVAHRCLWGSDWPGPGVPGMRANVDAFLALPLKDASRKAILHGNAQRLVPLAS